MGGGRRATGTYDFESAGNLRENRRGDGETGGGYRIETPTDFLFPQEVQN